MNKVKTVIGLILLTLLSITMVLVLDRTGVSSDKPSVDTLKKLNKNTQTDIAKNGAALTSSINTLKNKETKVKKPINISEGILIKKYPGNFACFKFQTPDGIIIISDPYQIDETVEPDIVTESHQHGDHTDVSTLKNNFKLINTIGDFSEKGIKIKGYSGKHNKGDVEGTNYIYVFDINGIKIAHFASQGELPDDETLKRIGKVDILLIQASIKPQYANSKLNIKECEAIIKMLDPKIVIPEHGSIKLGQALAEDIGVKMEHLSEGTLAITRNGLDDRKTIGIINLDTGDLY